jgi:hypothetical protein
MATVKELVFYAEIEVHKLDFRFAMRMAWRFWLSLFEAILLVFISFWVIFLCLFASWITLVCCV